MARLTGPAEASREVKALVGGYFRGKDDRPAQLWADPEGTVPADVLWPDGSPIPMLWPDGSSTPMPDPSRGVAPTVTIDGNSFLPDFLFPPGVDVVYVTCDGGPPWPIYAQVDNRLDALEILVAEAAGTAGAAETPAGAQSKADTAQAAAIAAANTAAAAEADAAEAAAIAAAAADASSKADAARDAAITAANTAASAARDAAITAAATDATSKANAAEATASTALSAHTADTTAVHGIADTAALVVTTDPRLSNSRTPTTHAASHAPGGGDPMAVDAATGVGSLRTLGAGAQQAAAGNDARFGVEALPVTIGASWTGAVSTSLANTARTVHATLTGNVTLTLPTPPATVSYTVTLVLTQDATGGRTLTLPQCDFAYGVAPVLSTAGGATDVLHLMWTGVLWIALMGAPAVA